jgi:agmatinase
MIRRHPWGGLADPVLRSPADVAILGLPYEGGACWRGGAAGAPGRLRDISSISPAISEAGDVIAPAALRVIDLGDIIPAADTDGSDAARGLYFSRVERAVATLFRAPEAVQEPPFLLSIGGDHSVTIPLVRGFDAGLPGGFGLVSLDAHPDLFDVYDGSRLANACPLRRALETGHLRPEHLVILGTRSYNEVELDFMKETGILFVPARAIDHGGVEATVARARERLAGVGSVYLTIDIDVADPSCAPGTGVPVAGGLSARQVLDLTRALLDTLPVRGMDLVEMAPRLDPTDATLFLGLQIVFETLAVLARRRPLSG